MPTTNAIRLIAWASRRPGMGPNQLLNFCDESRTVLVVTRQMNGNRIGRWHVAAQFHFAILLERPNLPARVILNQPLIFFRSERACPDDLGAIDVGAVIDQFLVYFVMGSIAHQHQMIARFVLQLRSHVGVLGSYMVIDRAEQITVLRGE